MDISKIIESLRCHVRVNVSTRTVELYDEYGVKIVIRDLDDEAFEAFKNAFVSF